jgi:hypothetical protein
MILSGYGRTIFHALPVGEIGVIEIGEGAEGSSTLVYLSVLALFGGAAEHYIKLYSNHPPTTHTSTGQISAHFDYLAVGKHCATIAKCKNGWNQHGFPKEVNHFPWVFFPPSLLDMVIRSFPCSTLAVFVCGVIIYGGLFWSAQAGN